MFVCVSVNPAIDKRLYLDALLPGGVLRATKVEAHPGGKAAHVAMALRALGADPLWIGLAGGAAGEACAAGLRALGLRTQVVPAGGQTRTNLEMLEENGRVTEIREPGEAPAQAEIAAFQSACGKVFAEAGGDLVVILSGSLPPGVAPDFYAVLIRAVHKHGGRAFLDTGGEALALGLSASPDFAKPNRAEAESLGAKLGAETDWTGALDALARRGAPNVAISLGSQGLLWRPGPGQPAYRAPAIPVEVRSAVGSGDATLAGFALAAARGFSAEETMRLAVACGTANCLADAPGAIRAEDVERFRKSAQVLTLRDAACPAAGNVTQ